MKKLIFIKLFLMLEIALFGQNYTDEQKFEIRDSVLALLADYSEYADFTKDGISINSQCNEAFLSLFVDDALIVNDIADKFQMITPESYSEIIKNNFPGGVEVKLKTDSAYFKNLINEEGYIHSLQVDIKKYTVGINKQNKIYRKDILASFTVRFKFKDEHFSNFKIAGIVSKELIMKRRSDDRMKGLYIGANMDLSAGRIKTKNKFEYYNRTYRLSPAFSGGLFADYWFSSHYAVSLGADYYIFKSNFNTQYNNEMNNNLLGTDIDGHSYYLYVNSDFSEKNTLKFLSVPVKFKYRKQLYNDVSLFASAGISASILLLSESYINGSSTHTAWYDEFNLIVNDAPIYNLGENNYNNTYDLLLSKIFFSAEFEIGVSVPLNKTAYLNAGISINHSFNDLNYNTSSYRDDYIYLHGTPEKVFLQSGGIFVSYTYKL